MDEDEEVELEDFEDTQPALFDIPDESEVDQLIRKRHRTPSPSPPPKRARIQDLPTNGGYGVIDNSIPFRPLPPPNPVPAPPPPDIPSGPREPSPPPRVFSPAALRNLFVMDPRQTTVYRDRRHPWRICFDGLRGFLPYLEKLPETKDIWPYLPSLMAEELDENRHPQCVFQATWIAERMGVTLRGFENLYLARSMHGLELMDHQVLTHAFIEHYPSLTEIVPRAIIDLSKAYGLIQTIHQVFNRFFCKVYSDGDRRADDILMFEPLTPNPNDAYPERDKWLRDPTTPDFLVPNFKPTLMNVTALQYRCLAFRYIPVTIKAKAVKLPEDEAGRPRFDQIPQVQLPTDKMLYRRNERQTLFDAEMDGHTMNMRTMDAVKELRFNMKQEYEPAINVWLKSPFSNAIVQYGYDPAAKPGFMAPAQFAEEKALVPYGDGDYRLKLQNLPIPVFPSFNSFMGLRYFRIEPKLPVEDFNLPFMVFIYHLFVVIAAKNVPIFEYVLRWIALRRLRPEMRMEVGLLLVGDKGIGKSLFMNILVALFGPQLAIYLQRNHDVFTDKFATAYWSNCSLVCMDEITCDKMKDNDRKVLEANLKTILTAETLDSEEKYKGRKGRPNRMGLIASSNDAKNPLPAGCIERRILPILCSPVHKGDWPYFKMLGHLMTNPAALAAIDLGLHVVGNSNFMKDFDRHEIPQSDFTMAMVRSSRPEYEIWWTWCLKEGHIRSSDPAPPSESGDLSSMIVLHAWPKSVSYNQLMQSFMYFRRTVLGKTNQLTPQVVNAFYVNITWKLFDHEYSAADKRLKHNTLHQIKSLKDYQALDKFYCEEE